MTLKPPEIKQLNQSRRPKSKPVTPVHPLKDFF